MTYGRDGHTHIVTARSTSEERRIYAERNKEGELAQHSGYSGDMETLFAQIDAITDNALKTTYEDTEELTQALQGLHMSQILGIDDDGADENDPNDIDISKNGTTLQDNLHALMNEYDDIATLSREGRWMSHQWNLTRIKSSGKVARTVWRSDRSASRSKRL